MTAHYLPVSRRTVLTFLLNSEQQTKKTNNKTEGKGIKTHSERSHSTVLFLGFVLPQLPTTPVFPKWNGESFIGSQGVCTGSWDFMPCTYPRILPHTESFPPLFFRPPNLTSTPQAPRLQNQWTDSGLLPQKCFCFCFLPLPRLPKALLHFWPWVSGSCFVTFVQIQKESPQTLPRCLYNSSERQERKQERSRSIRKQCSQ